MMTDQATIFNENKTETKTETTTPVTEAATTESGNTGQTVQDYHDELMNIKDANGKQKYSSVEEALKAIPHANDHISRIEAENAEYRQKLAEATAAEDLVAKIQQASTPQTSENPSVSMEAITTLVDQAIAAKDQQSKVQSNQGKVANQLTERFGDKAEEMYLAKGKELGLGPQTLNEIAGTSPEAVLAWFGESVQKTNPTTIKSTVVSHGMRQPQGTNDKRSVMGTVSDVDLRSEWSRIKQQVEAEYA